MLLRPRWTPRLAEIKAGPVERLVVALADDILEGRLTGGDRLHAHRDLAWALGIGVGTVTKAYAVLERRGLIRSIKGSGTFVYPSPNLDVPGQCHSGSGASRFKCAVRHRAG